MKKSMKRICIVLVLVMVVSMLPVTALAAGDDTLTADPETNTSVALNALCFTDSTLKTLVGTYGVKVITAPSVTVNAGTFGAFITYNGRLYEFVGIAYDRKLPTTVTLATGLNYTLNVCYIPHSHNYRPAHNRTYHWEGCACGSVINKERHVDPATDEDSICTCGYEFSHNADLVTLWLKNMVLAPRFNKDTTEYTGQVYTYKDVTATAISTRTFDALATVELPDDLTIEEGVNRFDITVTAEDRKTTKTYTVFAYKSAEVDDTTISSEVGITNIIPGVTIDQNFAAAAISEDAMAEAIEQASINGSEQIVIEPNISSWRMTRIEVAIPAAQLASLLKDNEAEPELVVITKLGKLTIPNAVLAELVEGCETVTVVFEKANNQVSYTILADEEDVSDISDEIVLSLR